MKKILLSVFLVLVLFVTVAFADEQQGLEQQNSQISQRMAELKRREKELAEREAKYKAEQEAAELAALEAEMTRREAEMSAKEAEAEKKRTAQKSAELSDKEQEFAKREAALQKKEEALRAAAEREAQYKAEQAAELAAREAELQKREAEIKAEAEKRLAEQKAAELAKKEQELAAREAALQIKEDALSATEERVINPKNFTAEVKTTISDASAYAVITQTESGLMNWTEDYIQATGMAVAPPRAKGAQGKALARRGATLDLQRNLLEALKGVQVDAETRMEDFMAEDTVMSSVSGIIKGVEVINGEWDGEAYTVTGRVKMQPVRSSIVDKIPASNKKAPKESQGSKGAKAPKSAGRFTGLIIDVRHLPLIPSMSFRVLDESGREVYSMSFVDHDRYMQSGLCNYYNNINFAKGELSVAGNPIVAKALRLTNGGVDIVISNSHAAKVRGSSYDFRKDCKVIIVKS